ncbi:MAG: cobalamin-binding protein [bacterium]|jgi:iron complex transport system substrate-binding protein|nr:MAG: cobalamin-binding protein [bacterium]
MKTRIASLLASGTEIVCALGLLDRLVAISHECDYPPEALDRPRVSRPRFDPSGLTSGEIDRAVRRALAEHGSVYEVDADALARVEPDLVLTQAVCEVCAVPAPGVRELVERLGLEAEVLSLDAHDIEGILDAILAVGRAAGVEARAAALVDGLRSRLSAVERAVAGAGRPRVLALEWLDPPFAPGHWVPEMVQRAGGVNLLGEAGQRSREVAWEDVAGMDPDVLIIMPCGMGLEDARADADRHARRLVEAAPRAIAEGRAYVVDGSAYFNRSGPRVADGLEILAGLLHPDRLPAPDGSAAAVWRPATA